MKRSAPDHGFEEAFEECVSVSRCKKPRTLHIRYKRIRDLPSPRADNPKRRRICACDTDWRQLFVSTVLVELKYAYKHIKRNMILAYKNHILKNGIRILSERSGKRFVDIVVEHEKLKKQFQVFQWKTKLARQYSNNTLIHPPTWVY